MASLRTRTRTDGTTSHQVLYRLDGKQASMTFETSAAALEFKLNCDRWGPATAVKILTALLEAESTITVAEMVRKHIDSLSGTERGTIQEYETALTKWITPHPIATLPVQAVTPDDVKEWVRWLSVQPSRTGEPLSAKSIKNRHTVLSGAFSTACKEKLRSDNPAKGVRLPKSTKRKAVFLTRAEFDLITGQIEDDEYRAFVQMLVGTGLRPAEAMALQVGSVDLDRRVPMIDVVQAWKNQPGGKPVIGAPKSKAGVRSVSLAPETVEVIRPYVEGRRLDEFVFQRGNGPITQSWFYHAAWEPARARAMVLGLRKKPRLYDLRHTHASWLIAAGVPLNIIQKRLGHESIQMTVDQYGHLMDDALAVAAEATSRALRGEA